MARPGLDERRLDDVRRDLDAGHQLAGAHDGAVERGEHLQRVDPVQQLQHPRPDVQHAVRCGQQVHAALVRAAGRQAPAGDGGRQTGGSLVLVQFVRPWDDDRQCLDAGGHGTLDGKQRQVLRHKLPALGPALAVHDEVADEDRPDHLGGRRTAGAEGRRAHSGQVAEASASSIARRAKTAVIAVRYSRSAWMSELTKWPSVACAAAAATTANDPSVPTSASSTTVAR